MVTLLRTFFCVTAVLVLVGLGYSRGAVLCLASGGHVALETSNECGPHDEEPSHGHDSAECCECVDIEITSFSEGRPEAAKHISQPVLENVALFVVSLAEGHQSLSSSHQASPRPAPRPHTPSRTVVLLI